MGYYTKKSRRTIKVYGSPEEGYGVAEAIKGEMYSIYDPEPDTPKWVAQKIAVCERKNPDWGWDDVQAWLGKIGIAFGADGKWTRLETVK